MDEIVEFQAENKRNRNWRDLWRDGRILSKSLGSIPSWSDLVNGVKKRDHLADTWASGEHRLNHLIYPKINYDDQARFQQRQLMEKEQKLLKMYEASQARVLGRLGGSQASTAPTGKVRQMFEERRTKAGIDKSYPLQPLQGAPTNVAAAQVKMARMTINGHNSSIDKSSKDVTIEIKHSTNFNGDSIVKSQKYEMKTTTKDINLNDDAYEDTVDANQESIANKLPNVGGSLPSQRIIKQETNNNVRNGVLPKKTSETPLRTNGDLGTTKDKLMMQRTTKTPPLQAIKSTTTRTTRTQAVSPSIKPRSVAPSPSQQQNVPSYTNTPTPTKPRTPITPVDKPKSPVKTPSTAMATKPKLHPMSPKSDAENACSICQRCFAPDRLQKHEEICSKTKSKKRKAYDAVKHRVAGTEVESYVKHAKKTTRSQAPQRATPAAKPSNWRKKHEEFIQAIRAAKQVQAHISKGGKLSDLPPPPPSDTSDYVACPHCNRRFNQGAAERHIPKCANFQFNKPKPPAKKR